MYCRIIQQLNIDVIFIVFRKEQCLQKAENNHWMLYWAKKYIYIYIIRLTSPWEVTIVAVPIMSSPTERLICLFISYKKKKNIFSKKQHHKKLTGKTLPEVTQPKCPITVFYSPPLGSFCTDSWGRPVNERSTLGNSLTMYKSNYLTLT